MSASFSQQPEMSSFDLQITHASSQAPSIASLHIPQPSVPPTAATSMLTVCPADDEKEDERPSDPSRANQVEEPSSIQNTHLAQVALTFLLVSGARRTMSFDAETTVGRVKELVWNAWPSDWHEEKPPAPGFLRILYLGKILQDEDTLSGLSLPTVSSTRSSTSTTTAQHATIVHLSIRPYVPPPEDEALIKKNLRLARRALSRSGSTAQPPRTGPGAQPGTDDAAHAGGCCGCIIA